MLLLSHVGKSVHFCNAMLNLSHNLSGPGPPHIMQLALLTCRKFHSGSGKKATGRLFGASLPFPKTNRHFVNSRFLSSGSESDPSGSNPAEKGPPVTPSPAAPKGSGKIIKVTQIKKKPIDYTYSGNVFILPVRAMNEFLLTPKDLSVLPKYTRRSPYGKEMPILMFLRSDTEKLAMKKWGSMVNIVKEKQKIIKMERERFGRLDLFQLKAAIEQNKQQTGEVLKKFELSEEQEEQQEAQPQIEKFWKSGSANVVISAICINAINTVVKFVAWLYTGSHSMFSEFIHSLADTLNQILLGIGLYHSTKKPDGVHPYGYRNLRHISSLISGVGIFCFGTGLSVYHGIQGLLHPQEVQSLGWAIAALLGTMVSEGATLIVAIAEVRKSSRAKNMKFWEYGCHFVCDFSYIPRLQDLIRRGDNLRFISDFPNTGIGKTLHFEIVNRGNDPNVSVVLLEDMAAVLGVSIAASCLAITHYTGNPFSDAVGSLLVGGILGSVASFIIYSNTEVLVGKSIPLEKKLLISQELEKDRMIRSLHDVKATETGGEVRFKAEVDFDGLEITRAYLLKVELENLLTEMQHLKKPEDAEQFMLIHGERIIDTLGEEVDRIEKVLKTKYPDLRHVDLEAL